MPLPQFQDLGTVAEAPNMSKAQREKVAELESLLATQPNYVLPEGFTAHKEL